MKWFGEVGGWGATLKEEKVENVDDFIVYCLLLLLLVYYYLLLYYKFLFNVLVSYLLCMISLILVLKNLRWELGGMKESFAATSMWRK